jgi:hypothetical protein
MEQKKQQPLTRGLNNNKHNGKDDKVETRDIRRNKVYYWYEFDDKYHINTKLDVWRN